MSRWGLILLALLAACGRIGFSGGDDGQDGRLLDGQLSVDAPKLSLDAGQCPASYMFIGSSCYRDVVAGKQWLAAEQSCEADAVGAHLVVVDDDAERQQLDTNPGLADDTWIGTSRRAVPAYRTVIDTTPWLDLGAQTEPSEDCLSLATDALMYLRSCTDLDDYICEYDGIAAVPSAY